MVLLAMKWDETSCQYQHNKAVAKPIAGTAKVPRQNDLLQQWAKIQNLGVHVKKSNFKEQQLFLLQHMVDVSWLSWQLSEGTWRSCIIPRGTQSSISGTDFLSKVGIHFQNLNESPRFPLSAKDRTASRGLLLDFSHDLPFQDRRNPPWRTAWFNPMAILETQSFLFDLTKVMSKIKYGDPWTKETFSVIHPGLPRTWRSEASRCTSDLQQKSLQVESGTEDKVDWQPTRLSTASNTTVQMPSKKGTRVISCHQANELEMLTGKQKGRLWI